MTNPRRTYDLRRELRNGQYRRLLDVARPDCTCFLLVIRPGNALDAEGHEFLNHLNPWIVWRKPVAQWPGTRLLHGAMADVLVCELNDTTINLLKTVDGLYAWIQPKLPEDLCLLRSDETPWLVTIAHENDSFLELTQHEWQRLTRTFPEIKDLVVEHVDKP